MRIKHRYLTCMGPGNSRVWGSPGDIILFCSLYCMMAEDRSVWSLSQGFNLPQPLIMGLLTLHLTSLRLFLLIFSLKITIGATFQDFHETETRSYMKSTQLHAWRRANVCYTFVTEEANIAAEMHRLEVVSMRKHSLVGGAHSSAPLGGTTWRNLSPKASAFTHH